MGRRAIIFDITERRTAERLRIERELEALRVAELEASPGELVRGIRAAVLTDHGLSPAVDAPAARRTVPTRFDDRLGERLAPAVETALYYGRDFGGERARRRPRANDRRTFRSSSARPRDGSAFMSLTHTDLLLAEHANRFAARHDGWEDVARLYAAASEPLFVLGVVALLAVGLIIRRRALVEAGVLALAAAGVALVLGVLVSQLADRSRPFVADPQIHAFLHHAADPGFPSDHATAGFAIAVVLVLRLGWAAMPVLVAALAIACSRVMLGLHYPGDVLAGALLGTLCATAVCGVAATLRPEGRPRTSRRRLHPASH